MDDLRDARQSRPLGLVFLTFWRTYVPFCGATEIPFLTSGSGDVSFSPGPISFFQFHAILKKMVEIISLYKEILNAPLHCEPCEQGNEDVMDMLLLWTSQ